MAEFIDEERWDQEIRHPDWYLRLAGELRALRKRYESPDEPESEAIKTEVRKFFERKLLAHEVALAVRGDNLDAERKPVDTIVIHHTSAPPGYTLERMNAVHLLNLYAPYYANPGLEQEKHLRGKPIWSNHFDTNGKQVFYGYHWIIRMDGSAQRLLPDEAIGWHAGNWDINTRSVAMCLDNDYEGADPGSDIIEAVAGVIASHYPNVSYDRILGHKEVGRAPTICPGSGFETGWKGRLLEAVGRNHREGRSR